MAPGDGRFAALFARTGGGMRYDLTCMRALLAALGAPERALAVVSVAGTNGKGSTSAWLAGALQQAGYRCGLFTSPHLHHFAERFVVDGQQASEDALAAAYDRVLACAPALPRPFSFFEACVAIAYLHFAAAGVQIAVMEAGLGGRLDATNVFPAAQLRCALLTRIDLDHQKILGTTRPQIAQEKAGLWRPSRPAIVGLQRPEVRQALRALARAHGVPATFLTPCDVAGVAPMLGDGRIWPAYLRENAALAWAGCRALGHGGVHVDAAHFAAAAARFAWPGRYQRLLPPTAAMPEVIVDGGHNPAGCAALATALAQDPTLGAREVHGLVGALRDKDLPAMVAALQPQLASLTLCATAGPRGLGAASLRVAFPQWPVQADVEAALRVALAARGPRDVVLVAGSLTLVAAALTALRDRGYRDAASA